MDRDKKAQKGVLPIRATLANLSANTIAAFLSPLVLPPFFGCASWQ
jgi:hypothetical protein